MKRSIFCLISTASLIGLTTIGFSTPEIAIAQQHQRHTIQRTTQEIQLTPSRQTRPTTTLNPQFQIPIETTEVQCGDTTCTCVGIDDCDALFTSTLCAPGTETTTDDDHGQCTKND
ncbi:MAG: hypothetical protein AAFY33_10110 [Cyanobacteria bacterium J06643_4]